MVSSIDPTLPLDGVPADKADLRANLLAAKNEIEALQSASSGGQRLVNAVVDYGAVGDGSTDNSTALIAMRDAAWAEPELHHVFYFPAGEYRYLNNRWLLNVRSYEVLGYGCIFRCIRSDSGGVHWFNTNCLNVCDPWSDNGDVDYNLNSSATCYSGHLFASAAVGATTVTCVTAADAGNFSAGDRVLLHGWAQQASNYPPNPRYHEWHTVVSAVAGTGVITLDGPLRFMYDERWRDGYSGPGFYWGAPRIMKLERTNYIHPVLAIFRGGYWAPNPNAATNVANAFQPLGDTVLIQDVRCLYYVPQVSQRVLAERVHADNIIEPDKVLGRVELLNCRSDGDVQAESVREATGVWDLVIDGLQARRGVRINSRNLTMRRSVIMGEPNTPTLGVYRNRLWAVRKVRIEDCTFINRNASINRILEVGTVETVTVASVASGALHFADTTPNRNALEQFAEIGTVILTRDGTKGGTITNIYVDTDIVVEGEWRVEPEAADVMYFNSCMDFSYERCEFQGEIARTRDDKYRGYPRQLRRYDLTQRDIVWTGEDVISNYTRGRIVRIAAAVDSPYTDSTPAAPRLQFYDDDSGAGGNLLLSVDLLTLGWREVTVAGGAGPSGASDTYGAAYMGQFCHRVSIRPFGGTGYAQLAGATYAELPKMRIIVDVLGP